MFWMGFAEISENQTKPAEAGAAPPPPEQEEEVEAASDAVNQVLMQLMPWGISILLHAAMILLAIFAVWTTVEKKTEDEEVIVPIARLSETPGAPISMRASKQVSTSRSTAVSTSRSVSTASFNKSGISSSISTGSAGPSNAAGMGTGMPGLIGLGGGAGGGGGGKASPFGGGGASGGSFKATFYGTGGNARRLGYLIDASGSLIDTLPFVITELKRSIGELSEKQSFTVVFFQGEEVVEVPPKGMKTASTDTKQKVIQWVDESAGHIMAMGATSPIKALQLVLRYRPHLLFILSDNITGNGRYEVDQKRLLREIELVNSGSTKINTIQFIYPDPLTQLGMKATMEMIAENTGGVYKYLDARELGIQ